MRILKEKYTPEEVEQRVTEVRNAIGSLQDSLYILISALDDIGDFRRSYVQDYVEQVEDLGANFEKDFEDIIYPKQEYDDEEFEESLKENNSEEWCIVDESSKEIIDIFNSREEAEASARDAQEMCDNGMLISCKGPFSVEPYSDFLTEDTIKTKDGKWVNKGDTGETHGKFKTKKEADAQRRAIFANWKK